MTTSYKNRPVRSPIQYRQPQSQSLPERSEHPLREEIKKLSQSFDISVSFAEDSETLRAMSHIENLIAIICTIRHRGEIVAQGRSSGVVNRLNRSERTINTTMYYSFTAAAAQAGRILEARRIKAADDERNEQKRGYAEAYRENSDDRITGPQRRYIVQLASQVDDEGAREQLLSELDSLSKQDASELIERMAAH